MKCLALFSGGLDSMLAVKLMVDQGIEVIAIHMDIGFGSRTDIDDIMKKRAEYAGATFKNIDVREEYIDKVLFNPKYGYGKHFNPCIDCHGFMFRVAKEYLEEFGADFMVTGEVIGQRPMSQRADAMQSVKKLADDTDDLILRPLSALNMKETKPEREDWVDRNKLLDINGRGREVQLELTKKYGWEDYESPGGGCLLTDAKFAKRMKEFLKHSALHVEDINILKNGRHLRLPDGAKLVIGRNQEENDFLEKNINDKFVKVKAAELSGPYSLLQSDASKEDKELSAKLVLTFTKANPENNYSVHVGDENIEAMPFPKREDAHKYFVI